MAEPYTIRIFVLDGDPEGVKIVERLNWTGVGVAFPRAAWPRIRTRPEFKRPGVYILSGPAENTADELPTIYVGQGDEIGGRIDSHAATKEFWEWGYAFVSATGAINRAHATWLEQALLQLAQEAARCHLDNAVQPREPSLSESERADTKAFLLEILRILPLLGVRAFEPPVPAATVGQLRATAVAPGTNTDERDTIVVPAWEEGFREVFLAENCWYAVRISGGMLPRIRYAAVYRTAPTSAITHVASVARIEPYGDGGKYRLVFSSPAKPLPKPIPLANAPAGTLQGPRYTTYKKLLSAKRVSDLFK